MGKGRAPCCDKSKVKRGPWSPAEDLKLITFIQRNGHDNWRALPKQSGLLRCGKSCRLRWINYLRPDVKRGNFTKEEEETIFKLHGTLGNKWSKIAAHFPGRTDNEIKNVWNTHLKKRLLKIADPSGDDSKESSIITSSSSSSSTSSVLSSRKRDKEVVLLDEEFDPKKARKIDNNSQEDDGDNDNYNNNNMEKEEEQEEISNCVYSGEIEENPNELVTMSRTTSPDSSISNLGDHDEDMLMDNLLLDFKGSYDISDVLEEANQSENAINSLDHLPMLDNECDFWDMFGGNNSDTILSESNNVQVQNSVVVGEEKVHEIENNKEWFKYLETELGLLESTIIESNNQEFDQGSMLIEEVLIPDCNFSDLDQPKSEFDPCLEFCSSYELWPSNLAPNSPAF